MIARFLRQARAKLLDVAQCSASHLETFNIVIGNEACDLDSAMSAIVYAWFLTQVSHETPQINYFFPVLNIPESLFRLRTETTFLLEKYGVAQGDIIFRDTVNIHQLLSDNQTNFQITLVDHHALPRSDEYMLSHVVEVIDHRPQVQTCDPGIKVEIATIGSCVTLIAERVIRATDNGKMTLNEEDKEELASLISGPIMIDTVNLSPAAGKVTDRDVAVINRFWGKSSNPELQRLYQELTKAKFSAKGLMAKDLMLKDAKYIESSDSGTKVMFSTIHDTLKNFMEREDAPECVPLFLQAEKYDLWVSLSPVEQDENGKPFKPIMLFSTDQKLREKIAQSLLEAQSPNLDLVRKAVNGLGENFILLRMYNIKASRKQVLPVVQEKI